MAKLFHMKIWSSFATFPIYLKAKPLTKYFTMRHFSRYRWIYNIFIHNIYTMFRLGENKNSILFPNLRLKHFFVWCVFLRKMALNSKLICWTCSYYIQRNNKYFVISEKIFKGDIQVCKQLKVLIRSLFLIRFFCDQNAKSRFLNTS